MSSLLSLSLECKGAYQIHTAENVIQRNLLIGSSVLSSKTTRVSEVHRADSTIYRKIIQSWHNQPPGGGGGGGGSGGQHPLTTKPEAEMMRHCKSKCHISEDLLALLQICDCAKFSSSGTYRRCNIIAKCHMLAIHTCEPSRKI